MELQDNVVVSRSVPNPSNSVDVVGSLPNSSNAMVRQSSLILYNGFNILSMEHVTATLVILRGLLR